MTIAFYDITVAPFLHGLATLSHLLEKAKAHAAEKNIPVDEIVEWRLIDDMKPFSFQIQSVCNAIKNCMAFCAHLEMPLVEDNEKTFADLEARVKSTIELLKGIKPEDVNGKDSIPAALPERFKSYGEYTGLQFFLGFNNKNYYFHLVTAYDILRTKGVEVGKRDFLRLSS